MADRSVHPAAMDPDALAAECEFRATRRSGPGGQNRNKVETAVILTHRPTGSAPGVGASHAGGEPSRGAARLRVELRWRSVGRSSGRTGSRSSPERLWRSRCRGGRIVVNPEHEDFPALLAEAPMCSRPGAMTRAASEVLGCSATQLVKLLKDEPRALARVNERRRQAGQHPLR